MTNNLDYDASVPDKETLEAIYALNIGDFVLDSFISDELLNKISNRLGNDQDKLRAQLEELIQIYSMDKTLNILGFESHEGFVFYDSIASTLAQMFRVDACHIFQVAKKDSGESYLSLTGTSKPLSGPRRWDIGIQIRDNDFLSRIYRGTATEVVEDVTVLPDRHPLEPETELDQGRVISLIATPLREGGKPMGLLVFESYERTAFSPELSRLAEATARIFVTATRLQQLVAEAQDYLIMGEDEDNAQKDMSRLLSLRAQITESIADLGIHQQQFVEGLSEAIDARNNYTRGHSKNVAEVARRLGETLELNEKTVDLIYFAGLLGSLGKVHIPDRMLEKKDRLSENEWDELRNHPNVGVSLLGKINFLSEVKPYVQSQKERWDGSGSPEGLEGQSIPLGARILALADAYQAMVSERPYREGRMSHEDAVAALQQEAGSRWDPMLVEKLDTLRSER